VSASGSTGFQVKRVYDEPEPADGYRVLVDRLWPRGLSRDRAAVDLSARDLAPSAELRRWFGHDPAKLDAFRERYRQELDEHAPQDVVEDLRRRAGHEPVTLLTATKDLAVSHAPVLADYLSSRSSRHSGSKPPA
jgi:uncharacterized protein YeaO (DUF488 family)